MKQCLVCSSGKFSILKQLNETVFSLFFWEVQNAEVDSEKLVVHNISRVYGTFPNVSGALFRKRGYFPETRYFSPAYC